MTEPPEPRRPEEGGGEEDYDAIWDSADADEIMGGLEDDALLDSIAQGVRGELGPEELTELLSGLRDVPDSTDIPVPLTARTERGENVLPPRTTEGSATPMTAVEDAARLRSAGARCYQDIGNALELFQQSAETLRDIRLPEISQAPASHVDVAKSVLGQGHANLNDIMAAHAALNELTEEIRTMVDAVHQKREAMQHVAGQIQGTFQDAATAIGGHSAG